MFRVVYRTFALFFGTNQNVSIAPSIKNVLPKAGIQWSDQIDNPVYVFFDHTESKEFLPVLDCILFRQSSLYGRFF